MRKCKKFIAALLCVAMIQNNINFTKIYALASESEITWQESYIDTSEELTVVSDTAGSSDGFEEDVQYDVAIPHVLINQVYGGKEGAYVSHSFIELYNPTDKDVDLSTWSLQYRSSVDGKRSGSWIVHPLSGTIQAHHSYLVRCGIVDSPADGYLELRDADEDWDDLQIHNKGISVVLLASQTELDASDIVFDNDTKQPTVDGYVDMFAVSGNDERAFQEALYYETEASAVQSKKKTIRRVAFQDTDNNSVDGDFEVIDYSLENDDYIAWISPRSSEDGEWDGESNVRPTFTVTFECNGGSFPSDVVNTVCDMGTAVVEPEEPIQGGYIFSGWYEDEDFALKYDFTKWPTGDLTLYAKWIDENAEEEKKIPAVYITTSDGKGNSLVKATGYVPATIRIDSDINVEGQIKVRGTSTSSGEKKPFTIKFSKKQDVCGMGAAKKWVLLANCFDPTLLRNYLALSMAKELGLDYTPEMQYVDLYLDGVYKGNYLLTEAIETDSERVNIDVDAGDFLIQLENNSRIEADTTYVSSPVFQYRFELKGPETPTDEQKDEILNALSVAETAMQSGDFIEVAKQIDVDSFVDYYILNEFLKSVDVSHTSIFFYYANGKLYAGPTWDYDLAMGNANPAYYTSYYVDGGSFQGIWAQKHWLGKMTGYEEFMQLVGYRYQRLQSYIQGLYVEGGFLDTVYAEYKDDFERNFSDAGWDVSKQYSNGLSREPYCTYEENYEYLRSWLRDRNVWLCEYWDVESVELDYSEYYHAVAQTKGYSAVCYENYERLEEALAIDVYRDGITQEEIDAVTQKILEAISLLKPLIVYKSGMPYTEEKGVYQYDVTAPHIVINQVYGGAKKESYASHSFIELYNPTDVDVDLSTWSVQYCSSADDAEASEAWSVHPLSGTIKAHHSYLIRCGSVKDPVEGAIAITEYDEAWNQILNNKGLSVVLLASQEAIDPSDEVYDNVLRQPVVAGYIDMFAVSGNDGLEEQKALFYETAASDVQSKKKTLRRVDFMDTDDNSVDGDFELIDYSFENSDYFAWISPRCSADGPWDEKTNVHPTFTVTYESNGGSAVEEETYLLGEAVNEPGHPVRENHIFEGWYQDEALTIKYKFSELPTGDMTLYAKWTRTEKDVVVISGIEVQDCIYTGEAVSHSITPTVTLASDENVTVGDIALIYGYSGIRADGSDYLSDEGPVDAGEYSLRVAVSEEDEDYAGSVEYSFKIVPAQLQLTAEDVSLNVGDPLPESYAYQVTGLLNGDVLTQEPSFVCEATDTQNAGTYEITPCDADAGMNYEIIYYSGTLTIVERTTEPEEAEAPEVPAGNLMIREIPSQTYTGSAIKPSVLVYSANGTLLKAGKDYTIKYFNNTDADTESEELQGGTNQTGEESVNGFTKDLAYVVITGKGNYKGTIYHNFHIERASISDADKEPADGFTLKYTEQLVRSDSKAQKPFTSLKYKKTMKLGTDYTVKLTALTAYQGDNALTNGSVVGQSSGNAVPVIPNGYHGTFLLTIEGLGNYTGIIERTIYIAEKNKIMKNATITLGKDQKSVPYNNGEAVTLTPGYYNVQTKKYYAIDENGIVNEEAEKDGKSVFTVKAGTEYLKYGEHYTVTYTGNRSVGSVTMTIEGIQEKGYFGSKSITFRIVGTAFTTKNISMDNDSFKTEMSYTGKELTQDGVILRDITAGGKELVYGTDYTISYRNNVKKGTATMIFTPEAASGYSGSFKKTFKITAAALDVEMLTAADSLNDYIVPANGGAKLVGEVPYTKEGTKPAERILLTNAEGIGLQEGIDYTISYADNRAVTTSNTVKAPSMSIKGKGNYTGTLKVFYEISPASMENNKNLTITAAQIAFNAKKAGMSDYRYQPKIKIMDGRKALSASKDYQVSYQNCGQSEVKAYLDALKDGNVTEEELYGKRPYAIVTAKEGSGYTTGEGLKVPLTVYETKLTGNNLYIVISEDTVQTTYTGAQVKPEVTVYYGTAGSIKAAKNAKETDAQVLTDREGRYGLTMLSLKEAESELGDYTLTYGENVTAGKNKGRVTVTGAGLYGGSVTVIFTIQSKDIYTSGH